MCQPFITLFVGLDSSGSRFYFSLFSTSASPKFRVYVTTRERQPVLFDIFAEGFEVTAAAVAGEVTTITLPDRLALSSETDRNKGIQILSRDEKNISVYAGNLVNTAAYSFLAYPPLSDELESYTYIAVTKSDQNSAGDSLLAIVATSNDTFIQITPTQTATINGEIVENGTTFNISLNNLETLLLLESVELTGTTVLTNHPVTFFSGHECGFIGDSDGCDPNIQQLPPVEYWGSQYASAPLMNVTAATTYHIVAGLDCTTVNVSCNNLAGDVVFTTFFDLDPTATRDVTFNESLYLYCWFQSYYPIQVFQYFSGEHFGAGIFDPAGSLLPPINHYSNSYTIAPLQTDLPENLLAQVFVPEEFLGQDEIFLDGAAIDPSQFIPILYEDNVKMYAIVRELGDLATTLFHLNPAARLGVLVYGLGITSYAHPPAVFLEQFGELLL